MGERSYEGVKRHSLDQGLYPGPWHRLQEASFILRQVKCKLGMSKVEWFGHRFSGARMRVSADKASIIKQWPRPVTVREEKSFLAMFQFKAMFLAVEKEEIHSPSWQTPSGRWLGIKLCLPGPRRWTSTSQRSKGTVQQPSNGLVPYEVGWTVGCYLLSYRSDLLLDIF